MSDYSDEEFSVMQNDFYYGLMAYLESLVDGDADGAKNSEYFMIQAASSKY